MIAVDTNVLVYAHREESLYHERAAAAVRDLAEGDTPWGLPVFVLGEFLRVVTHPRVYAPPTSRQAALATVEALLASPTVRVLTVGSELHGVDWRQSREPYDQHGGGDATAR